MLMKCEVCGRDFVRYDRVMRGRGKLFKTKRPSNCVTCSKKCSRIYKCRRIWEKKEYIKNETMVKDGRRI